MSNLLQDIASRKAQVTVIGIGYVGLPLAVEIARAGFRVTGLDKSADKVHGVLTAKSYIGDVSDADLALLVKEKKLLTATTDPAVLAESDVVIICVPTPLNKTKEPDNSFIMGAAEDLRLHLHKNQLVVLESTTFPGFTREVLLPKLQETGLKVGQDFYLCFSPERVDPGNPNYHTKNTPKVVGGTTLNCLEAICAMYGEFLDSLIKVSSTDAAEMVKLLENTFRAVNIGLVNEVAIMSEKLGLDTWEIINAAATKPFGFMPFYPGPGLGGHCIPVDPLYLSWKLKTLKYEARFITLADEINSHMPDFVVEKVQNGLNDAERAIKGSKILVVGVAYKKNIDDVRESPALDVIHLLQLKGATVTYHDTHVPSIRMGDRVMKSQPLAGLGEVDCVLVLTDHSDVDYARVVREAKLVVDTRNATRKFRSDAKARIIGL